MAETRDKIWKLSFDVNPKSLENLRALETQLSKIEQSSGRLSKGKKVDVSTGVAAAVNAEKQKVAAVKAAAKEAEKTAKARASVEKSAVAESVKMERQRVAALKESIRSAIAATKERARIEKATANAAVKAEKERMAAIRRAGNAAIKAAKQRAREEKRVEQATLKTARAAEKAAKEAQRARQAFKSAFLAIGSGGGGGFGAMARNAAATALAFVSLHRVIQKIGEAKDRYLRFDELTTAAMNITHAGEQAFQYGSKGAERYRDALREAANEVKVAASEMSDSALFWAKAGQTNADTIVELSKVGTMFARANRDAENNVLDQARANDILSDALQLFRKDTSTTEKAREEAVALGDKLTAAANSGNIVVEQLFDYSKKVAGLFKTGEVADDQIMAIATSLASAGLKEESGVHVRRILTRLAQGNVQKMLADVGVKVSDESGSIRSFGDIFGEIQNVLKDQKPLERMGFLKDLFGQRAVATAAAMAGLNEEGAPAAASINEILKKIQDAEGLARRNQDEYLKTTSGRVQALTSEWGNALDKVLEDSGIIQKLLGGLENIDPVEIFGWMETVAVPALEKFGITMRDVVIPGVVMTAENIGEWLSPAMSALSSLLGGTTSSAEGFADTMTTLVKLWIKWRIALMAIKGLRMIDWFADFAKKATMAATATKAIGTTTTQSVGAAKTALGGLAGAFSVAGVGITAAIAAWGIYDAIVGPIKDAEKRIAEFKSKYGNDFGRLKPGKEDYNTLAGRIRDAEKSHRMNISGIDPAAMSDPAVQRMIADGEREIQRLKEIQAAQVRKETGVGKSSVQSTGLYSGARSETMEPLEDWSTSTQGDMDQLWLDFYGAVQSRDAELMQTAQEAYESALNEKLALYQDERSALESERDETYERFSKASGEERDTLNKQLGFVVDRLKENAEKIGEYTSGLDEIAGLMSQNEEREIQSEAEAAIKKEREVKRRRSFKGGGKTEKLNPFATPMLSGLDNAGNRVINIALQQGNAAEYYKRSPESRKEFERQFKAQNPNVYNISFGDNSLSVTAKSDAKPKDIAREVQREWWKIGERQRHDVERVLGVTVPPEI